MISFETFGKMAMSFPEAVVEPHFERSSFRVNKKIFATYDEKKKLAYLKFSIADQDIFSLIDKLIIYPVGNKWGKQGWTLIELEKVRKDVIYDALTAAYCEVASKKLAELVNR